MRSILNNHNRKLLDELNRNSGVPDEVFCHSRRKEDAPWTDNSTQRTSYSKRAFLTWNIIMMGRGSI